MAQHLRVGSRVTIGSTFVNALVTNITDAYLEFEHEPTPGVTEVRVYPWGLFGTSVIVTED